MKQKIMKIFQKMKKIIIKILTILKILKKHENEIKGDDDMKFDDYRESVFDDRPTLLEAFKGLKDFVDKTNTENDVKFTNINNKIDEQVTNLNNKIDEQIANVNNKIDEQVANINNQLVTINARPKTVVYENLNLLTTPTKTYTPENYSQDKVYVVTIYLINPSLSIGPVINNTKILFNDFTMPNEYGNITFLSTMDAAGGLTVCGVTKETQGITVRSSGLFDYDINIIVKIEEV